MVIDDSNEVSICGEVKPLHFVRTVLRTSSSCDVSDEDEGLTLEKVVEAVNFLLIPISTSSML